MVNNPRLFDIDDTVKVINRSDLFAIIRSYSQVNIGGEGLWRYYLDLTTKIGNVFIGAYEYELILISRAPKIGDAVRVNKTVGNFLSGTIGKVIEITEPKIMKGVEYKYIVQSPFTDGGGKRISFHYPLSALTVVKTHIGLHEWLTI